MTSLECGQPVITEIKEFFGVRREYRWIGGPVTKVDRRIFSGKDFERIGPYKLRRIPIEVIGDYFYYIRWEPWWWPLWAWLTCTNWFSRRIQPRIILTLAVWGLAKRPYSGEVIDWHLLRNKRGEHRG
jgi:hypothetical protein